MNPPTQQKGETVIDLHSMQNLVLNACKENIKLNKELESAREEIHKKNEEIKTLKAKLAANGFADEGLLLCRSGSSATSSTTQVPDEELEDTSVDFTNHRHNNSAPTTIRHVIETSGLTAFQTNNTEHNHNSSTIRLQDEEAKENPMQECETIESDDFDLDEAVEDIQRWFFMEGGNLESVEVFVQQYCAYLRDIICLPVDRFFLSGVLMHPKVSCYVWKWEVDLGPVEGHEIPEHLFSRRRELFKDAPFTILHDRRAETYRMKASETAEEDIPKDCGWYTTGNYSDFYALPMYHQDEVVGALSWATKETRGFSSKHISFFEKSCQSLTKFLRLHTNDMILTTLANRLEDEVQERTRDLRYANEKILLQSANQIKNFAMCSHEIRTPLNCIIGLSSLLIDTDLDESQEESLRMIVRSGDLLLSVVNDVLDYSRLENGHVDINFEPTNLRAVVNLVLHSMAPKVKARRLMVERCFGNVPSSFIQTDGSRLQQILYNLLGNSAKFSHENGTIQVSLQLLDNELEKTKAPKMVRIAVKDFGKGIPKSDLAQIFEPFNQGSENTARVYGGTGLGLAITANLVKGLNGTITADSEFGKWTEFVVNLPYEEVDQIDDLQIPPEVSISSDVSSGFLSEADPQCKTSGIIMDRSLGRSDSVLSMQSTSSRDTLENDKSASSENRTKTRVVPKRMISTRFLAGEIRILVVDDNMVNRKVLVRMLDRVGAKQVDIAENGLEACELEESNSYDLVLMDMEMPIMGGLEATERILARRRTPTCSKPKVVFVTAHALDTYHAKAVAAGGSGFLTKPFNLKKLTSILSSVDLHFGCRQVS